MITGTRIKKEHKIGMSVLKKIKQDEVMQTRGQEEGLFYRKHREKF